MGMGGPPSIVFLQEVVPDQLGEGGRSAVWSARATPALLLELHQPGCEEGLGNLRVRGPPFLTWPGEGLPPPTLIGVCPEIGVGTSVPSEDMRT